MRRTMVTAALGMACLSMVPAQAAMAQDAAAQTRFDEAVRDMGRGDYAAACPKLEKVVKAAPDALGAREQLGECYEKADKLASAWTTWRALEGLAANAGQKERETKAASRSKALSKKLPTLKLSLPPETSALTGVSIAVDGAEIAADLWSVPLPVDAGPHEVVVSARGRKAKRLQVTAKTGATVPVDVGTLEPGGETVATPDVVWLKDGGRIRCAVIEEDPDKGVRVKLSDGNSRTFATGDVDRVEYGAKSARTKGGEEPGTIHITSAKPGTVSVDGAVVGPAPVDVRQSPGRHEVSIEFDGGGDADETILVEPGGETTVALEEGGWRRVAPFRAGAHAVLFGEGFLGYGDYDWGGIRAGGGANIGVSHVVDFRLLGYGGIGGNDFPYFELGGRALARFNFGDVYGVEAGVHVVMGMWGANATVYPEFGGGPVLSLVSLRFGEHRQVELSAPASATFRAVVDSDSALFFYFQQAIGMSYLFL